MSNLPDQEIVARVKQLVAESSFCQQPAEALRGDESLQYDLGMDSLAAVELLVSIEEAFGLATSDEDILNQHIWMQSINSVAVFIAHKLEVAS